MCAAGTVPERDVKGQRQLRVRASCAVFCWPVLVCEINLPNFVIFPVPGQLHQAIATGRQRVNLRAGGRSSENDCLVVLFGLRKLCMERWTGTKPETRAKARRKPGTSTI